MDWLEVEGQTISFQQEMLDILVGYKCLAKENESLRNDIVLMAEKLDGLAAWSRSNNLILRGESKKPTDILGTIAKRMWESLLRKNWNSVKVQSASTELIGMEMRMEGKDKVQILNKGNLKTATFPLLKNLQSKSEK